MANHLNVYLALLFISILSSCVKIESHLYYCDENAITSNGLEKANIKLTISGKNEKADDGFFYSKHNIDKPYKLRFFISGQSSYLEHFKINQAYADFKADNSSEQIAFTQFENVKAQKESNNDLEYHVIALTPDLNPTYNSQFNLTIAGTVLEQNQIRDFTFHCEIRYEHRVKTNLPLVN